MYANTIKMRSGGRGWVSSTTFTKIDNKSPTTGKLITATLMSSADPVPNVPLAI